MDRNPSLTDEQKAIIVALLAEGVDRNRLSTSVSLPRAKVALLAEGVDRNGYEVNIAKLEQVALLAEGVDRNSTTATSRKTLRCRPPRGGRG